MTITSNMTNYLLIKENIMKLAELLQQSDSPWHLAYWFSRMLINNDKYVAISKEPALLTRITSSLKVVADENKGWLADSYFVQAHSQRKMETSYVCRRVCIEQIQDKEYVSHRNL
jgi:hypothetical protein